MSEIGLDFNLPIMHNRDEVIAIKFSGCLKNACEVMLSGILNSNIGVWRAKYPGIERVYHYEDPKEAYYNLMYMTPKKFLMEARAPREPLSEYEIAKDLSIMMGKCADPYMCSTTSLEVGLFELAKYGWCKKIIVYDTAFNDRIKRYMADNYKAHAAKIYFFEGFLKELILKCPEVTTYFVDDVEELMILMEYYEALDRKDLFKEKQFFVQGLASIASIGEDGTPTYRFQDYMRDAGDRFDANVTFITSHYIDLESSDTPKIDLKYPEDTIKKNPD